MLAKAACRVWAEHILDRRLSIIWSICGQNSRTEHIDRRLSIIWSICGQLTPVFQVIFIHTDLNCAFKTCSKSGNEILINWLKFTIPYVL